MAFHPKRDVKEKLIASFGTEAGMPIITKISTPFICGSTPRLYYGVCHTTQKCEGIFLITNPTDVPARWTVEHVVGGGAWKKSTAIRVKGE